MTTTMSAGHPPAAARQRRLRALPCLCLLGLLIAPPAQAQQTGIQVNLAFAPASIVSGATSQMVVNFSITGNNSDNVSAVLQAAYANALPPGLTVAASTTSACAGASANAGASSIVFAVQGVIPAAGCQVTVTVTGMAAAGTAYFTNTIPANALQTTLGTNGTASATLAVQAAITVPSVSGLSQTAAAAQLTAAGFVVALVQQPSDTILPGGVIGTVPAAGAPAARQSTVQLLISSGPGSYASAPISTVPGLTQGQASVARSLEQVCGAFTAASNAGTVLTPQQRDLLSKCSSIINNYLTQGNTPQLQSTLTAVSGRQATAAARAPMQFAAGQVANLSERLSVVRSGGAGGLSFNGLGLLDSTGQLAAITPLSDFVHSLISAALGGGAGDEPGGLLDNRLGVFLTGTLRRGSQSSTDAESGFRLSDTGATLGADYRLGDSYVIGVSSGFGRTTTGFDNNGGRLDARHLSGQLYGSFYTGAFHLDAVAGYIHNTSKLTREILYQSDSPSIGCDGNYCSEETTGSTTSRELTASLGAGWDLHSGAFAFGPTLESEYKQVHVNGFHETGLSGLDLSFGDITTASLVAKAGGYVSYAWKTRYLVIVPQLRARYMHEFLNKARSQNVQFYADSFADAGTRSFQIYTDAADRSFYDWKASVLFQLPFGIAGFIDYGGVGGMQNLQMHEFNVGLRIEH